VEEEMDDILPWFVFAERKFQCFAVVAASASVLRSKQGQQEISKEVDLEVRRRCDDRRMVYKSKRRCG
jgi:hypothetical protein